MERHDANYDVVGYEIAVPLDDAAQEAVAALLVPHLAPAPASLIDRELARLRASCIAARIEDDDLAMRFDVLMDECEGWPADVVRSALRGWAAREKYFPTLAEVRDALQRHGRARRSLGANLERALSA